MTTTKNYLVGFIVFTGIILSGMGLINLFAVDNVNFIDSSKYNSFNQTFNKYSELNESTNALRGKARFPTFDELLASSVKLATNSANLVTIGINGLNYIIDGFGFITDTLLGLDKIIPGFPSWASGLIVLGIIVIFAIIIIEASLNRSL